MFNVVNTLPPSFLIGSSSFLQVARTTVKFWISSKFGQIQPCTAEIAALDRLKKYITYLRRIQNIFMTCWLSVERSLPFGLLVFRSTLFYFFSILFYSIPVHSISFCSIKILFCSIACILFSILFI